MPKAADTHTTPMIADDFDGRDAELVRLHRALVEQDDELARIEAEATGDGITPASMNKECRISEANDVWWSVVDDITAIRARGVAGRRAKAATMLLVLDHIVCEGIGETIADIATEGGGELQHRLALSLARDVLDATLSPEAAPR